jgi:hypothetical protein
MDKNLVLVSGALVFKEQGRKIRWFVVKQTKDGMWEIPKVVVRKGESSVRGALRMMGEKGAMTTKVLEEVGRAGGVTTINGRILPQRHIYYLMILKSSSNEAIGFEQSQWLEYAKARRTVSSKREKAMIREASKVYRAWKKEEKNKIEV